MKSVDGSLDVRRDYQYSTYLQITLERGELSSVFHRETAAEAAASKTDNSVSFNYKHLHKSSLS